MKAGVESKCIFFFPGRVLLSITTFVQGIYRTECELEVYKMYRGTLFTSWWFLMPMV